MESAFRIEVSRYGNLFPATRYDFKCNRISGGYIRAEEHYPMTGKPCKSLIIGIDRDNRYQYDSPIPGHRENPTQRFTYKTMASFEISGNFGAEDVIDIIINRKEDQYENVVYLYDTIIRRINMVMGIDDTTMTREVGILLESKTPTYINSERVEFIKLNPDLGPNSCILLMFDIINGKTYHVKSARK